MPTQRIYSYIFLKMFGTKYHWNFFQNFQGSKSLLSFNNSLEFFKIISTLIGIEFLFFTSKESTSLFCHFSFLAIVPGFLFPFFVYTTEFLTWIVILTGSLFGFAGKNLLSSVKWWWNQKLWTFFFTILPPNNQV